MLQATLDGNSVQEAARIVPILEETDVVIAGGGMSGYSAAIAAAQTGARTMLVERLGFLGGLLTACLAEFVMWENDENGRQIVAGIWQETKQRLIDLGACPGTMRYDGPMYGPKIKVPPSASITPFNQEVFKQVAADQVLAARVRLLLHTSVVGVVREGERVRGVIAENMSGRFAILGKVTVDATGDADLCHAVGAPCQKGRESDGRMMGVSQHMHVHGVQAPPLWDYVQAHPDDVPRWARLVPVAGNCIGPEYDMIRFACHGFQFSMQAAKARGELYFTGGEMGIWPQVGPGAVEVNVTRVHIDPTEVTGLTTAEVETRRQAVSIMAFLRRHIPGFQNAHISHLATEVQCRETRRIVGDFIMGATAVLESRRFADAVALASYPMEVHNPETGQREWQVPSRSYQIPYRIFHPRGVENLIVGSARSLSATHEVGAALRIAPIPLATGQAAGVAAALAARRAITPALLDPAELREALRSQGAVLD